MASNSLQEDGSTILVLDCGSQYSHLIARRLREIHVYSIILPCTHDISDLPKGIRGIILSGGPFSVYSNDAPRISKEIFDLGVPILGICYGMQWIAWSHGQETVVAGEKREYGLAALLLESANPSALFEGLPSPLPVWMSHGDKLNAVPPQFITIGTTANSSYAAIAHKSRPFFGIQFHPEVSHTSGGLKMLDNFVAICNADRNWNMGKFAEQEVQRIRSLVGPGQAIGAVSGGVDSTVAAKLMHTAIGSKFHAVFVDNGLLRENEAQSVKETLTAYLGINLHVVDASDRFLAALANVTDPEQKRKIIGRLFITIFKETALSIAKAAESSDRTGSIDWLMQGTLYTDVIESSPTSKGTTSTTIKSHHNVGGLPDELGIGLLEPLRNLYKDEVRELGKELLIPEELCMRHPFPGPGLAIRVLGEVTKPQLQIVREVDTIFTEEIRKAGLYRDISQSFACLLPLKAVGVMGDKRMYSQMIVLRAVQTTDFMTATSYKFPDDFQDRVSTRIVNEVEGVCRVFYDWTSKPPGTIEME